MSTTITVAQVQQYRDNIILRFQQEGSILRPAVRVESTNAKYHFFELLAPTRAVKGVSRHSATPQVDSLHSRRRAGTADYAWSDLIDEEDKLRLLVDPQGPYAVNAANALGRAMDKEIIEAFNRSADEGETGGTVVAFPTTGGFYGGGNVIAHGSAGLTVGKLRQAMAMLDLANVPMSGRHFVGSPIGKEQLLRTTEVTSSDFNTVKALVQGEVNTYLGFQFHWIADESNDVAGRMLPKTGNIRSGFAWHERVIGLAISRDVVVRVDQLPTMRYATQVYAAANFGAVRVEDAGVIQVDYDEAV